MVLLLLWPALSMHATLPPPAMNCASVDQAGNITITWTPPADPLGEFVEYRIFSSDAADGPFILLSTVPALATSSFQDPLADGRTGPMFYYITTVAAGPPQVISAPGDTISTIFLQVFQSIPPGSAALSWNHLAASPSAADSFSVWMEYPAGVLQRLAVVPVSTFSYQHIISICEDSLTFHIRREGSGCTSVSNWSGDVFRDVTAPSIPVITTVTVDTSLAGSNRARIEWAPSPEADTDGYIIVFDAPGGAVIIDTVWGAANTVYEWDDSTADLRPESYTVAAFDTCLTGTPPNPNTSATQPFHTTMQLVLAYDQCAGTVDLTWTPYVGWATQVHTVYMQVDNGPWLVTEVLGPGVLSHQQEVEPLRRYCFVVAANQGAGLPNSLSNRLCLDADYPGLPSFNYLRTVTVTGETEITILDSVDASAWVDGYRLERSDNGGPFEPVAFQGPSISGVITFVDTDVRPSTMGYQYRVVVLDDCGNEALTSNIGSNILLSVTPDLRGVNSLFWNGYQDWGGWIQSHAIFRTVDDGAEELIATAPPDPWSRPDDVSSLTDAKGRFCYTVMAIEAGNPSGLNMTSRSNKACTVQQELVYIPNAFTVGGRNPVFKPELAFADVADYELSIINRWGQVFWTTNDPEKGWDGTSGGQPVPLGVYAYYCNFRNGEGREFEKRGTVTMLMAVE